MYVLAALALVLIPLVLIGWRYFGKSGLVEKERWLSYWAELQEYRDLKPIGEPTRLTGGISGETYFREGDGIRFFLEGSDDGHLYLINGEYGREGKVPQYTILFPSPDSNNRSSHVKAEQGVATSVCDFDATIGTEKVWIVWSVNAIPFLEDAIGKWANKEQQGQIKDPDQAGLLRQLLEGSEAEKPQVERDEANERITLRGRKKVIVYLLKLTHIKR